MRFAHGHYGGITRSLHTVMMCLPRGVRGEAILAAAWRPRRFVLRNAAGDSPDLVFLGLPVHKSDWSVHGFVVLG